MSRPLTCLVALALAGCTPVKLASLGQVPAVQGAGGALSGLGGAVLFNGKVRGQVLGPDGLPAANVPVSARVISNNGGSALARRTLAASQATTDADGRFELPGSADDVLVVEAAQGPSLKAIRLNVRATDGEVRLQLAATGTITGKLAAPERPEVTDFTGVDVYIPGTSYVAKANATGAYLLANVPVGDFVVVAGKDGLGRGSAGVHVAPRQQASAPAIALHAQAPVVAAVVPPVAAPGQPVELRGQGFGTSSGAAIAVALGGSVVSDVKRLDDHTLRLTLPPNTVSGDLVVTVAGVAGAPVPVGVAEKLVPLPGRDALLLGEGVPLAAAAVDHFGRNLGDVAASWRVAGEAVALDAGRAVAKAEGVATLSCSAGSLAQDLALPVRRAVGITSTLYDAPAGSADRPGLASIAPGPDGTLYAVERGLDDAPGRLVAIDATGAASPVALPFEPLEVVAGYVLAGDGGVWQLGASPTRVLDPATIPPVVQAWQAANNAAGPGATAPGGVANFKPHGLVLGARGDLVFQFLPGLALRFAPGKPLVPVSIAPPNTPGLEGLSYWLAAGSKDLWAYVPRPKLTPALEVLTDGPPGAPRALARDPGTVGGFALDGQDHAYLAVTSQHTIVQVDADGSLHTLAGSADGSAPPPERAGLTSPRQVVAAADGRTLWLVDGPKGSRLRQVTLRRAP